MIPVCSPVDGQIGMWPLNKRFGGSNLVDGQSDLDLHNVIFTDVSSQWFSPIVRFSGESYGKFATVSDLSTIRDFGWIATIYRETTRAVPMIEWWSGDSFRTHIWIFPDKLFINLFRNGCGNQEIAHSLPLQTHEWYTVAVSYDYALSTVSMWVNGLSTVTSVPSCPGYLTAPTDVWINRR